MVLKDFERVEKLLEIKTTQKLRNPIQDFLNIRNFEGIDQTFTWNLVEQSIFFLTERFEIFHG